jgi:RNA polymerase sigma factor (sigma-70 family)
MASEAAHLLTKHLRNLSAEARADSLPDRELVERFVLQGEEEAFAALVRRHGPMVLRVCQRVLHDTHDAEDAFQAVFLVLSRKAASLRRADSVGCWLHGVASRLALKARTQLARQRKHEGQAAVEKHVEDPLAELTVREAQAILDEELARLPEKYRAPLVLCCLEGQTRDEAARQLGWSTKLLKSRLEQGRERLRSRLSQRGLTLPAALIATLLAEEAAPAALPTKLVRAAVQTARAWPANAVSAPVALLAEGALGGTGTVKVKVIVGLLLLTGVLAAGVGALAPPPVADAPGSPAAKQPSAAKAPEPPKAEGQRPARTDRYGDPLPSGALARLGTLRFRPGDPIAHIAFSPDGKLLATATQNMEGNANLVSISLWDRASGKRLRQFGVGKRPPFALAFAPDGQTLAAQDERGEIHLWDMGTGKELRRIAAGGIVFETGGGPAGQIRGVGFVFSPDGKALAARGPDKAIHLWETATGKELQKLKADPEDFSPLAFSRDGKMLATSAEKMIRLWDVETGKEKTRLRGHEGSAGTPAFSADGKTFAALARTPGQIYQMTAYVWDIAAAKLLHKWDLSSNPVFASGISPDGKTVLTGGDISRIRRYDLATGKEFGRLIAPFTGAVFATVFSPDGKTIAAAGENRVLQLWDAESGKPLAPFTGHQGAVRSLSLSANGKYLASVASDERIVLWDMTTAQPLAAFQSPKGSFSNVAFSPDGRTLAVVGEDLFVRLLEVPSGKELRRFPCARDRQRIVAFSPDGRLLAAGSGYTGDGSRDKSIRLWETATGKLLHQLKPLHTTKERNDSISDLAFSPDGRLLASGDSEGGAVDLWDVATGKMRCQLHCHRPYGASSLGFSLDGHTLVTTSCRDKTIGLWEVWSGQSRGSITGHSDWVGSLAFSPDGLLASASHDKTVRIWNLNTGEERGCFRGHDSFIETLTFSSDGQRLVSGSSDTTILVWDMNSLPPPRRWKPVDLSPKEFDALWAALADTEAAKAYRAIRTLLRSPPQVVSFLKDRLRLIEPVSAEKIAAWIADLDSDRFPVRSKAERELEKLEERAEPALRRALRERPASLELRRRLEGLLKRLEGPITSTETLRQVRAVEVLEHVGSPEARQVLRTLAEGAPKAILTREAKAALGRAEKNRPRTAP